MKKVTSVRNDRGLINKQPRQDSGLCCFSFARWVTQIYEALYGDAMFVSF